MYILMMRLCGSLEFLDIEFMYVGVGHGASFGHISLGQSQGPLE